MDSGRRRRLGHPDLRQCHATLRCRRAENPHSSQAPEGSVSVGKNAGTLEELPCPKRFRKCALHGREWLCSLSLRRPRLHTDWERHRHGAWSGDRHHLRRSLWMLLLDEEWKTTGSCGSSPPGERSTTGADGQRKHDHPLSHPRGPTSHPWQRVSQALKVSAKVSSFLFLTGTKRAIVDDLVGCCRKGRMAPTIAWMMEDVLHTISNASTAIREPSTLPADSKERGEHALSVSCARRKVSPSHRTLVSKPRSITGRRIGKKLVE